MEKMSTTRLLLSIIIIIALAVYSHDLRNSKGTVLTLPDLDSIPARVNGFESTERALTAEEINILGADKTLYRIYSKDDKDVIRLFIGYFSAQQENSQIHSPKHCYPGAGWNIAAEGKTTVQIGGGAQNVKYILISDGSTRRVVLYWFRTFDSIASNEFELKWIQMKNAILRKPQMAAFVRLSTDINNDEDIDTKLKELAEFARAISPSIEEILKAVKKK